MLPALSFLLPIGLGGAISPVMLTEQTVLLAGPGGRRAGAHYAAGVVITLLLIIFALVFFGRAISLPAKPVLSASLDVVLGVALLGGAMGVRYLHIPRHSSHAHRRRGPRLADRPEAAFPFGIFSMATNFTTLALLIVAAKEIATAQVATGERVALILFLVAMCSVPAWAPLALVTLARKTGEEALHALGRLIAEHGRAAVVVLLAGAGIFLMVRGVFHLV